MNTIVDKASHCVEITEWESLMKESENMLSSILNLPTVKESFFSDYPFEIKSLGAWGAISLWQLVVTYTKLKVTSYEMK